jgi:hypothetical protein
MSNNPDDDKDPIPDFMKAFAKRLLSPEAKMQIITVILEIQNREIKELKERVDKLEQEQNTNSV